MIRDSAPKSAGGSHSTSCPTPGAQPSAICQVPVEGALWPNVALSSLVDSVRPRAYWHAHAARYHAGPPRLLSGQDQPRPWSRLLAIQRQLQSGPPPAFTLLPLHPSGPRTRRQLGWRLCCAVGVEPNLAPPPSPPFPLCLSVPLAFTYSRPQPQIPIGMPQPRIPIGMPQPRILIGMRAHSMRAGAPMRIRRPWLQGRACLRVLYAHNP